MTCASTRGTCRHGVWQSERFIPRFILVTGRLSRIAIIVTILYMSYAIAPLAETRAGLYAVTQKGQQFNPRTLTISRRETVSVINDDGELIHHAYVDSKLFSFDSGDQEPGSTTNIVFTVPGSFVVLCGIHPKMRLDVAVK
jgi:plastocyanin